MLNSYDIGSAIGVQVDEITGQYNYSVLRNLKAELRTRSIGRIDLMQ
jgi:hypothetical protein